MVSKHFLTAGKATVTLENTSTKKHQTYRITRGKKTQQFPDPALFVSVMTGADNESTYSYMGVLAEDLSELRLTKRSRFMQDSLAVLGFRYLLRRVASQIPDSEMIKVHHSGRCGRCSRLLTHPDSIESGIGPECGKHVHPGYHSTAVHTPYVMSSRFRREQPPQLPLEGMEPT